MISRTRTGGTEGDRNPRPRRRPRTAAGRRSRRRRRGPGSCCAGGGHRAPGQHERLSTAPRVPGRAVQQERCLVLYAPQTSVNRAIAAGLTGAAAHPKGWGAGQIERAYKLPVNRESHATVAVSIAFDTPHLARYLAVYRKQFGLPPCTLRSGCFRKVNQKGQARPLPPSGVRSGWDLEATLDVSMISAACPHCKILVVEANSPASPTWQRPTTPPPGSARR